MKKKAKYIRVIKIIFIIPSVIGYAFFLFVFIGHLLVDTGNEPEFRVYGDSEILNKMKINIEMRKVDSWDIQTLLYKDDLYKIKNLVDVYFLIYEHCHISDYKLYFMYNDSLVGVIEKENFHRKISRNACNDIYIEKRNDSIFVSYLMFKENSIDCNDPLIPLDSLIEDLRKQGKEVDIQKFTHLYE